ncbi:MAG: hypothetical protein A2Z14_18990 [Chloroflexi bacterium RBG_16_48_8]|nr:MAG: hypothetical protein A2Z14_18990 [Chloroflexi bacterium RBG_16_48_8]
MKIRKRIRICLFIVVLLLQGCAFDFEPAIPTIGFQSPGTQPQPFQGFGPTPTDTPEMIELIEAVDMLFDPYQGIMPGDILYESSVYQAMNDDIREAYKR